MLHADSTTTRALRACMQLLGNLKLADSLAVLQKESAVSMEPGPREHCQQLPQNAIIEALDLLDHLKSGEKTKQHSNAADAGKLLQKLESQLTKSAAAQGAELDLPCTSLLTTFSHLHPISNIISCSFHSADDRLEARQSHNVSRRVETDGSASSCLLLATGSADGNVVVSRVRPPKVFQAVGSAREAAQVVVRFPKLPSPVLSVRFCPTFASRFVPELDDSTEERERKTQGKSTGQRMLMSSLVATCLNGTSHILAALALDDNKDDEEEEEDTKNQKEGLWREEEEEGACEGVVINSFKDHSSHVVSGKWNPTGRLLATSSHDGTVVISTANRCFEPEQGKGGSSPCRVEFGDKVEALAWLDERSFVVGVRGSNYLRVFDAETLQEHQRHNMNSRGDDHVSFAAMDIVVSHHATTESGGGGGGDWLLVATDKDRSILFANGTNVQCRNFFGAANGAYSNPRVGFSSSNRYVYTTSENYKSYSFDVGTSRVLEVLEGHTSQVRDLCVVAGGSGCDVIATCSFDKTVRLWGGI